DGARNVTIVFRGWQRTAHHRKQIANDDRRLLEHRRAGLGVGRTGHVSQSKYVRVTLVLESILIDLDPTESGLSLRGQRAVGYCLNSGLSVLISHPQCLNSDSTGCCG